MAVSVSNETTTSDQMLLRTLHRKANMDDMH